MDIQGTTVLVLGGGGMVGRAVCRELIQCQPARIVVCSLVEAESLRTIKTLQGEQERALQYAPSLPKVELINEWGNLFGRSDHKHLSGAQMCTTAEGRRAIIEDTLTPMSAEVARRFFLYQLVLGYKPDIIIDAINTATGIAYTDIFTGARQVWSELQDDKLDANSVERLLCSLSIPQLIRHVDVLYRAMVAVDTKAYLKLGTSGTGGMGWNIPYTHGEERPSSVLLSKSAVAGAHTLLLFLLARTPGIASLEEEGSELVSKVPPATMEIKPTAMIGWRSIGHGEILKRGQPIVLEEVPLSDAISLKCGQSLPLEDPSRGKLTEKKLSTVYVDTGENGLFSTEEFIAITSPGQMEFVTPEEIARNVVDEVRGRNTGKDVINALSVACMGPTFRAGFQRERAIQKLRELEKQHGCESVAFENLGPPRLSKLLYEASLLKRAFGSIQVVSEAQPADMAQRLKSLIEENWELRATPISIGVPIIWEEAGELRMLRGRYLKTPHPQGKAQFRLEAHLIEEWSRAGWIDLRESNMQRWRERMLAILGDAHSIPLQESSSRYVRDRSFWAGDEEDQDSPNWAIHPGEIVAWIFINEDKGERGRE